MDGYKVTIPVPEGVPNGVKETLIQEATDMYGGVSITEGRGTYVRDDGSIDDEAVTYVSVCMDVRRDSAEWWAKNAAKTVRENSDEECVMWEITEVSYGFE